MPRSIRFIFDRLFHRDHLDRLMNEEISLHIIERAKELERQGIPAAEAHRQARVEFGGMEKYKEQCRETRRFHLLHDLADDLFFATRLFRKAPGFTAVVLITLTLGIGANTTMFTLMNALIWRNLPVPQPQQLVHFGVSESQDSWVGISLPMLQEISQRQTAFSSTFAWWGDEISNVEICNSIVRGDVYAVTGNFYSELGAIPESGRLIGPQDASLISPPVPVAVVGRDFLDRQCGTGRNVVGQVLKIEGVAFTIIGIAPRTFTGLSSDISPQVTIPITCEPAIHGEPDWQKLLRRPAALWLDAGGRLKPGITIDQARAQLEVLWPSVRDQMIAQAQSDADRDALRGMRVEAHSIARGDSLLRTRFSHPVWLLLAISAVLLLLACVNLAGLMLARAGSRRHEFGVRISLGASRGRVIRQMLTETLVLAFVGSGAGFLFALWASRAMSDFVLGSIYIVPARLQLAPDARMLSFSVLIAIMTGIVFGVAPAWTSVRQNPQHALQQSSRTVGHATSRLGRTLVVAQISLSLVMVAAAGLLVRSLENLRTLDPGYRTSGMLNFDLFPKAGGYRNLDRVPYYRELTERVSRLPDVESAGLVHSRFGNLMEVTGKVRMQGSAAGPQTTDSELVTPGLFATMQIPLLSGRDFTWQDDEHAPSVAIVSQKLAERLFAQHDPIGQRLDVFFPKEQQVEIVGVVGEASLYDLRKGAQPTFYLASTQHKDFMGWSELMVRTGSISPQLVDSVRTAVSSMGHEYVPSVATLRKQLDRSILQERATGILSGFLAGLALLLATVGLFGLLVHNVTSRTREIGIRVTLGAGRGEIRSMILRETFRLLLLGCAVGLALTFPATRFIAHMLFGISAHDPATIAITIAALGAAGFLAALLPAWRAMRVDPIVALRCE